MVPQPGEGMGLFLMRFPVYALALGPLREGAGLVAFRSDTGPLLPLFTDECGAEGYVRRAEVRATGVRLPTALDLLGFLRSLPPQRFKGVVMDPLGPDAPGPLALSMPELIQSLEQGLRGPGGTAGGRDE